MARQRYQVDWSGHIPRIYEAPASDTDAVTLGEAKQLIIDHMTRTRDIAQGIINRTRKLTADDITHGKK